MLTAHAITKNVRVSPRKARLAAALIRGLSALAAMQQLQHCQLKSGRLLAKTLKSAIVNAESLYDTSRERLVVEEVRVDEGQRLKRAKPKNRGGRHPIIKRMSHFTVVVRSE